MDRFHFSLFKFKSFYHEIYKQRNKTWTKILFINGLFQSDLEILFRNVIHQAFKAKQSQDLDTLTEYCFSAIDEVQSPVRQSLLNFDEIKSTIMMDRPDAYSDEDQETLEKEYSKLWSNFVKYLDCNFDSFVSLKHLGQVLEFLKSKSESVVNRQKPAYLDPGKIIFNY